MKNRAFQVQACLLGLALLASCSRDFSTAPADQQAREFTPLEKSLIESGNPFGFELFREIVRTGEDVNVFISPFSASMALGMTLNGAAGTTETGMQQTLGFTGWEQEDINASYQSIMEWLLSADPATVMEIANSIWYRDDFSVLAEFISANQEYFDAEIRSMDFDSPDAPDIVNVWVSDKTHGRIPDIIDRINPTTVMMLINALYFKGTWHYEFNTANTRDDFFTFPGGGSAACKMMQQKATLSYMETDAFQAVELPYGNGSFAMTIFLPKPGHSHLDLAASFTVGNWQSWKTQFSKQELTLQLPKFKVEYEIKLNDVLSALGMAVAFDPSGADFTNINPEGGLYISLVKQKTFVEVDEKGTEAAAVTVVVVDRFSGDPPELMMRVDRPFLFMIREVTSDAMLFMGKIVSVAG
ncbi:serpin family protein [bacterium]|nr:serpin family protein [bacterium]